VILAMASDLRVAARNAKTAFLFTRVGLSGADMGACAILPRIVGHGRAAELLFTGRNMDADEGLAWGFWNRLSENPLVDAQALAGDIARGPTLAHAATKRQLDAEWHVSIETALDMEAEAQAELMQTNDFKRAYQAFCSKAQPVFRGD
jgi:enoyl-CoA hydratase/carnithine racemase